MSYKVKYKPKCGYWVILQDNEETDLIYPCQESAWAIAAFAAQMSYDTVRVYNKRGRLVCTETFSHLASR